LKLAKKTEIAMYKNKKILAIIPARGGSKGLPQKNIKMLRGKPLIGWTIEQAKNCPYIDEIFVSTDSMEIAGVCRNFGIDIPFLRPAELASDTASSMDVIEHVINSLEKEEKYFDYIMLLEPTSPLRKKDDLKNILEEVIDNTEADGLVTLGEVHMEHPMIVKRLNKYGRLIPYINEVKKITRRQDADKAYFPYGVAYVVKAGVFKKEKTFYTANIISYLIERWQNYEVDDIYDFLCIEAILNEKEKEI
jgi:CMP-N-acetylneuraminic acid synthetase